MPYRQRNHGVMPIVALLATIIFLVVFGEIIAHLYTFVLVALIPTAYFAGISRERMRQRSRSDMLRANTEYGRVTTTDAVSAYPPDMDTTQFIPRGYVEPETEVQTGRLSREDILSDPRSGVRKLWP